MTYSFPKQITARTSLTIFVLTLAATCWFLPGCQNGHASATISKSDESPQQAESIAYWRHKAQQHGISAAQKTVYEQLAKLMQGKLCTLDEDPDPQVAAEVTGNYPILAIQLVGLDALPALVEALDDKTNTKVMTFELVGHPDEYWKTWKLNELTAYLIFKITDRDFTVNVNGKETEIPDSNSPQFKKAVLDWYAKYAKKPLVVSKIDDLDDWDNYYQAAKWLGDHKAQEAVPALVRAVDRNANPNAEAAVSAAAYALGQIGNKDGLPAVRRACKLWLDKNLYADDGSDFDSLFNCFHGLALLGEKDEALKDLQLIHDQHWDDLSIIDRQDWNALLEQAKQW